MQEVNKRIAKNTVIVYIRLFVTMIVGLITSRYVLQALGASDFGLYNVVAGVLAMITFISGSMSATTTRYINFEMGKEGGNVNRIFNVCQIIHIFLALIILVLAETIGVFYIINYLNVEPMKRSDAMFVFQVSTIVACVGIINAPYQGLLVAQEKFGTMAKVEISNTLLKLFLVLSLFLFKNNILRVYSVYMSVMTFVLFVAYHWVCIRRWPNIVKWNTKGTRGYFREIIVFSNYDMLASGALMLREQGTNILINFYFNTVVNAAYSIARAVQGYVNIISNNFDSAAGPRITQNYSSGNWIESENLTIRIGRYCLLITMLCLFPLIVELDFILHIWLGTVPEGTLGFCMLTLVLSLVSATSAGVTRMISAAGKVKWFKIEFTIVYLICLPAIYISYKNGLSPLVAIFLFIIADIVSRIIQLILLKRIVGFNSLRFVKEAYLRPFIICALMVVFIFSVKCIVSETAVFAVLKIFLVFCMTAILEILIGLSKNERTRLFLIFKSRIRIN
jgi:O-antigen/teichoic acid export membrane protein